MRPYLEATTARTRTCSSATAGVRAARPVQASGSTGLAHDATAVVADHLDIDVTDAKLTQYAHDQFYATCVAWSVPDDFLKRFASGTIWSAAGIPDDNNGHFTPLSDVGGPNDSGRSVDGASVSLQGYYRLFTSGAWCWVSPKFIASVRPQSFVTFSALQFNKATGYDSHGRHVSDQAAKWVALGGDSAKVAAVVALFPAKGPVPAPHPVPVPVPPHPAPPAVTLTAAIHWAQQGVATGLTTHWPK